MADPRACGPLARTCTGSLLNGFNIPAVVPTLSEFPAPVRALIDNWTMRMDGVVDTDAVIDLAIVFAKEAMDYADASRSNQQSSYEDEPSDENEDDKDSDGGSGASSNDDDNDNEEEQDQSATGNLSQADTQERKGKH